MSTTERRPRVTVGVPVFNGGEMLREALDGLLAQSFTDFEIVISDNASTDATPATCREFAARDARIRVLRQPTNVGPFPNFLATLDAARGEYFCWAAHDDLRAADFLALLVAALDAHPNAGLAACQAEELDVLGLPMRLLVERGPRTTVGLARAERLLQVVRHSPPALMYGLFRTEVLRPHARILTSRRDAMHTDLLLLHALLADHDLAFVERPLLRIRMGGDSHRTDRYRTLTELVCSHVDFAWRSLRCISTRGLTLGERARVRRAQLRHVGDVLRVSNFWSQCAFKLTRQQVWLTPMVARIRVWNSPPLRRLAARMRQLPAGTRVALFGAGKHTVWLLEALRVAIEPHARLVGVIDDRPGVAELPGLRPVPVIGSGEWESLQPELIVASSQAYEEMLADRARRVTAGAVPVWMIYADDEAPAASDFRMNVTKRCHVAS